MGARPARLDGIDVLRGLVMVVMVIDHTRDYFTDLGDPQDVATATPALFFTRWITHFCAPVFVFLAGTSAWIHGSRGRSRGELSTFLVTRGLWLVLLECTVVTFGWMHEISLIFWQVIAAIGVAMIALAGLVHLPRGMIIVVGLFLTAGQDLYAPLGQSLQGGFADLWRFLHGGMFQPAFGFVPVGSFQVLTVYPVLPWIGVMALGYGVGPWARLERKQRRARFARAGLAGLVAFVLLRVMDGFGNVRHWSEQSDAIHAVMSFLDCEKYPPSLAYLAMTLGPALLALAALDRAPGRVLGAFRVFGRVPLFFYVLHIYLVHCAARLLFLLRDGEPVSLVRSMWSFMPQMGLSDFDFEPQPEGFRALSLGWVYLISALVVVALYPLCSRYAALKQRSNSTLLSYL